MESVEVLRKDFNRLPINSDNFSVYFDLLNLDSSVFYPVMKSIITGGITIEDLRPVMTKHNNFRVNKNLKHYLPLLKEGMTLEEYFLTNFMAKLEDKPNNLIKEALVDIDPIDYQETIRSYIPSIDASQTKDIILGDNKTHIHLKFEDIEIREEDLNDDVTFDEVRKNKQILYSNLLALIPNAR